MSKCTSGRHNYEHLGTSCDDIDKQLRLMREVALGKVTLASKAGPTSVWDQDGFPSLDAAIPDSFDPKSGRDLYGSGFIGTARDDDATDD